MRLTIIMGLQPGVQNRLVYTAINPEPRVGKNHILRAVAQIPYQFV
jgi:hypothetical protein